MKPLFALVLFACLSAVSYGDCPNCYRVIPHKVGPTIVKQKIVTKPGQSIRSITRVRSGLFHRFVNRTYIGR